MLVLLGKKKNPGAGNFKRKREKLSPCPAVARLSFWPLRFLQKEKEALVLAVCHLCWCRSSQSLDSPTAFAFQLLFIVSRKTEWLSIISGLTMCSLLSNGLSSCSYSISTQYRASILQATYFHLSQSRGWNGASLRTLYSLQSPSQHPRYEILQLFLDSFHVTGGSMLHKARPLAQGEMDLDLNSV